MNINKQIRELRKERNISTTTMGRLLGMTQANYSRIENSIQGISLDVFLKICTILKINPMQLIEDDNNEYLILPKEDMSKIQDAIKVLTKLQDQSKAKTASITINDNHGEITIAQNGSKNRK